jgi:endonuclease/exonuclease/phosphatase (EEP) superfamily protein YafD
VKKPLSLLADWIVWGAAALGLAVALAVFVVLTGLPLFDLLSQFAAPTLSLCILALVLALVLRRWRSAGALGLAIVFLALALGGQWRPAHPAPQAGASPVRIYFANVWNENQDIARIARSEAHARPDVAAMVEFSDQHRAAQSALFAGLPYRVLSPGNPIYPGRPGAVIASRWPLTPLVQGVTWNFNIVAARVQEPGAPFRVVVVHLTRPWPFRKPADQAAQIARLEAALAQSEEPTVVLGDFNATLSGLRLKRLMAETGYRPAGAVIGDWPSALPGPFRIAIENAFASHGLTLTSRRIGEATGSDHRPIVLEAAPAAARR